MSQSLQSPCVAPTAQTSVVVPQYTSVWDLGDPTVVGVGGPPLPAQSKRPPSSSLSPQLHEAYSRLRAALATRSVLARTRGTADGVTQVMLNCVRQQMPQGWVTLGFNGDALYWHDTVLNYTTWRVPDRPAGVQRELLEPLQERRAAGVAPPPPPPIAQK